MPIFRTVDGFQAEFETPDFSTSNTFSFAEKYALQGDQTPSGTRLFVGGLSMNARDYGPVADDEVLVGFEHGERAGTHPDFLWAPDWIL